MSISLWFVGIALVLVLAVFKYFQNKSQYWPSRGFTLIGSETTGSVLVNILTRLHIVHLDERIYRVAKKCKQPIIGSMEFGISPIAHVMDPDLMKHIFIKDFDYFTDRRPLKMDKTDPMIHRMLFFMEGEAWKELRGKMSPTFTTGKIRRMFKVFHSSSNKLVDFAGNEMEKNNGVVDFNDAYERLTMDVIASAAFGIDSKTFCEESSIFHQMGKKMQIDLTFKVLCIFILMVTAPRLASALGIGVQDKTACAFFTQVILSAINQREESGVKRDDFLQLMLEARNGQLKTEETDELSTFEKEARLQNDPVKQNKVLLTDDVIVAQSVLFILAGFDTTQSVLLFIIYHLAVCPDVQEKLAKEVRRARQEAGGEFTYESINQLEYLDQVINETLRLYPPVPRMDRQAMADYKVPGTELVIPKGVLVSMPTYSIQRDEEYYPDPDKFNPERFGTEEKSKRHPMTFQPFGHGPRNCIGMRFALTNTKMATASLVDNFIFEPSATTAIPPKLAMTSSLKPEGGVSLKVKRRDFNTSA